LEELKPMNKVSCELWDWEIGRNRICLVWGIIFNVLEIFKVSKWGLNVKFNYSCFYNSVAHLYPKSYTLWPAITLSHWSNEKAIWFELNNYNYAFGISCKLEHRRWFQSLFFCNHANINLIMQLEAIICLK